MSDQIYKNLDEIFKQLTPNQKLTPESFSDILLDDTHFDQFTIDLLKGVPNDKKPLIIDQLHASRSDLLLEYENVSSDAIPFMVSTFSVISEYVINNKLTQYVYHEHTKASVLSIPIKKYRANIKNYDNTEQSYFIPRVQFDMVNKPLKVELLPNTNIDLFSFFSTNPDINKKDFELNINSFNLYELEITQTNTTSGTSTTSKFYANGTVNQRGALLFIGEYTDFEGNDFEIEIGGNLTFNNWNFNNFYRVKKSKPGMNYTLDKLFCDIGLNSKLDGKYGTIDVSPYFEVQDVNIDIRNHFRFSVTEERIQDFRSIFDIDILKDMSKSIVQQMQTNYDAELKRELNKLHYDIYRNNALDVVNLQAARDTYGWLSPGFIWAIFQYIVPRLFYLARIIKLNYRKTPNVILCGIKTATILESLQDFTSFFTELEQGYISLNTRGSSLEQISRGVFGKMSAKKYENNKIEEPDPDKDRYFEIISSPILPDDVIYMAHLEKSPEIKENSTVVNFIYKPLYVIEELSDSLRYFHFKSRTTLKIIKSYPFAALRVVGMDNLLSQDDRNNYRPNI